MIFEEGTIQSYEKLLIIHSAYVWLPQTQTWMYNQIRYLPVDMEPHIVCERTENLDQFGLPNIHSFSDACFARYVITKILRKLRMQGKKNFLVTKAQKLEAKILHSHFGHIGWENMAAAKKARLKHVVAFYGFDASYLPALDPAWRKRYEELFRECDCILCEGPSMVQRLTNLGCPPEKTRLQRLGIEVEKIQFKPRKWDFSEPLRVLIAASFQEKKGIPYALEALGHLQHKVDLTITIIGDANEEERSKLEKRNILAALDKHNLMPKARLLSYQPYTVLFEEAYKHHIFLSPSVTALDGDTEGGLPVSIIEMAATGMLIVSSRHCDIPDVVHHGQTGLLTEEKDVAGIIANIEWLTANPDQWLPIVTAARAHVEKNHDAKKQGMRLAEVYRELTRNG